MNTLTLTLATAAALALAACTSEADIAGDGGAVIEEAAAAGTIVDIAQGDETFSTLVSAVTAAGLGETLAGEGPFTVFAPTNDAFGKIDAASLANLVENDTETLGVILTYHVVAGSVDAATLTAAIEEAGEEGYAIATVNGATLTAKIVDGAVVLTDGAGGTSTVEATDVEASNGLIHVIDTVLTPG